MPIKSRVEMPGRTARLATDIGGVGTMCQMPVRSLIWENTRKGWFVRIVTEAELEELAPANLESLRDYEVPIFCLYFIFRLFTDGLPGFPSGRGLKILPFFHFFFKD
jgi:hypothetical protein